MHFLNIKSCHCCPSWLGWYFSRPYAAQRYYQKSQALHRTVSCSGHLCHKDKDIQRLFFARDLRDDAGCAACFNELSLVLHLSMRDPFVLSCTTFGRCPLGKPVEIQNQWWGFTGAKVPTSHILYQGGQQGCSCLHCRSRTRKVGSDANFQPLENPRMCQAAASWSIACDEIFLKQKKSTGGL